MTPAGVSEQPVSSPGFFIHINRAEEDGRLADLLAFHTHSDVSPTLGDAATSRSFFTEDRTSTQERPQEDEAPTLSFTFQTSWASSSFLSFFFILIWTLLVFKGKLLLSLHVYHDGLDVFIKTPWTETWTGTWTETWTGTWRGFT